MIAVRHILLFMLSIHRTVHGLDRVNRIDCRHKLALRSVRGHCHSVQVNAVIPSSLTLLVLLRCFAFTVVGAFRLEIRDRN